jgi:hypothetical protein
MRNLYKTTVGNLKGSDHSEGRRWEDIRIDKEIGWGRMWTGFIRPRVGTSDKI